ncbi:hypothetical protein B0T24DRAFT_680699 [Lasiosphaeria ovina]|uniref:Uncharacterized protein n=1 Tax=Lasiosphaeria ovina TaxID=92902 RepID=A0AAE0N5L7_9PEZI|nr:hypothetical protein B0T24DRAFT_680699 [Lasiosphaeria ovina]
MSTPAPSAAATPQPGPFDWFGKIGATPQAVAVLNDQPNLFTILILVLKKKKEAKDDKKPAAAGKSPKPPAQR